MPSFIVLERGSNTARMRCGRAPGDVTSRSILRRRPAIVVCIAVGWCAKSSYTLMPTGFAAQLQAAPHVLEARQRRRGHFRVDAHVFGGGERRQRVELIVLAEQRPLDARDLQAAAQHVERVRFAAGAQGARLFLARAEALHLAPAAALEHASQRSPRAH